MLDIDDARGTLATTFGLDSFRPGQEPIIGRLLDGRSALAILPTGGGKSLCYQLPALLLDGLTVVVSPLIALMKDQVDRLVALGVAAARLDSSLDAAAARDAYARLAAGRITILYVSPERFSSERFLRALDGKRIALMAVDEAHCISRWGHNFRPDYLRLARTALRIGVERVLALTATATPAVADDIAHAFGIAAPDVVRTSFHRPNLDLRAMPTPAAGRMRLLLDRVRDRAPGPAIVYVTLQKTAQEVADALTAAGHDAAAYHAGLGQAERDRVQGAFMGSGTRIVVATIAFGMGIDKADIRYVDHYNLPASLEAYAQEVGRAGRDGLPATCTLFGSREDALRLENFSYGDTPEPEAVAGLVADVLGRGPEFAVSIHALAAEHDIREAVVKTALAYLEIEGALEATGSSYGQYRVRLESAAAAIAALVPEKAELLESVLAVAKRGRIWRTIDVVAATEALGVRPAAIASLVGELEAMGLAVVEASNALSHYRRHVGVLDRGGLAASLSERFAGREAGDIERVDKVVAFASAGGCLTRALLSYFGEDLGADCGHCGPCLGIEPTPMPAAPARHPDDGDRRAIESLRSEGRAALATPRAMARFLCGLTSPATTRARLTKDERFGSLAEVPFATVLDLVRAHWRPAAIARR